MEEKYNQIPAKRKAKLWKIILDEAGQVTPAGREVFHLISVKGLSIWGAARETGTTVDTIRVRKARVLYALHQAALKRGLLFSSSFGNYNIYLPGK